MTSVEEGSRSADLMARMLKELQQINAAQHLQDSLRADLQKRREQARQCLIANQKRLEQVKCELSGLYQQEAKRHVLCDISNTMNVDATQRGELINQNLTAKQNIKAVQNEQIELCLAKIKEHDIALENLGSSSVKRAAILNEAKELGAALCNLERKIAGITASKNAATTQIAKLQNELGEAKNVGTKNSKALSDVKHELNSWLEQEKEIVDELVKEHRLSDLSNPEFVKTGMQWLQKQEDLKANELRLITEMIQQRQKYLKLNT